MTKGILKAVPGPFPQALRWSEGNLLAVSSGPFVTIVVRSSGRSLAPLGFAIPTCTTVGVALGGSFRTWVLATDGGESSE